MFFFIVSVSSSFEGAQTEKRRTGQFSFCEAWPLNSFLEEQPEDDAGNVWGQAGIGGIRLLGHVLDGECGKRNCRQ